MQPGVRSTGGTGLTIKTEGEIIPSYLSITAPLSQIYHSVQAARGGRWVPNITNHGIHPAENLLMCLNRAAERSNAVGSVTGVFLTGPLGGEMFFTVWRHL